MTDKTTHMLKDAEARNLVKTQLSCNIILEAGAGSGKTSAMAGRFVSLVCSGTCDISEIVAITFTRKAANELKERVRHELLKAGSPLASEIHTCFIGTIHAFCSKLLRERPIEGGVDPQFTELDEGEDRKIREMAWEEYVMSADENRKMILARMEIFDLNEDVLKRFLQKVCENPDLEFQIPTEKPLDEKAFHESVDGLLRQVEGMVADATKAIPTSGTVNEGKTDGLQKTISTFNRKMGRKQNLSLMEKLQLLKLFNTGTNIKVTQKCWGDTKEDKAGAKALGEEFEAFKEDYISELFKLRSEYGYNHVAVPFVREARQIYNDKKRVLGALNFQDLLQGATSMLRDHPEVRAYFQKKYKVILVDEFQDTDPVQAKMLLYLSGKDIQEKQWDKLVPIPGSLFVVGDPKQSIYGFRRADIDIYNKFKEIITDTGGIKAELTTNFRSVGELEKWYNWSFPQLLLQKSELAAQAEYASMETVIDSLPGTLGGIYKYKVDASKVADIVNQDCGHIERIIRYLTSGVEITVSGTEREPLVARPVEYRDIMILYMRKASLTLHSKALAEAGIPIKVVGADVVKRTPEFYAFADIVRMLAYPEENALLYKVLRGTAFGFTDEELYKFKELGGSFSIYSQIDDKVKEEMLADTDPCGDSKAANTIRIITRIEEAFSLLKKFAYYMKKMVPAAAAERIIDELGITARMLYSGYKLGELGSFLSLVERIRMKNLTNVWDLNQFIEEIQLMIEAGFEEDIELEGEDYNGVRMMNLHKAKGLEAPIIILAVPCSGKAIPPNFYVNRTVEEGKEKLYGIASLKLKDGFTSKDVIEPEAWKKVKEIAQARNAAEKDRLLYVAATRARNMLIVSDSGSKDNPWAPLLRSITNEESGEIEAFSDIYRMLVDAESEVSESGESLLVSNGQEDALLTKDKMAELIKRTHDVLSGSKESYQTYTPSEKKNVKVTSEETPIEKKDFEVDSDLILRNSMEVYFEGDQEVLKTIRTDLGTAVHKVFEGLINGTHDKDLMIGYIANQINKKEVNDKLLHSVADQFLLSSLFARVQKCEEVYTEVPLSLKIKAGETFSGIKFDTDCYVNGFIDLVMKEEDGWTIVDYKTCGKSEVKSELVKAYQSQLDGYKEAWEIATSEKVAKTEIFFVEKG